MSIASDLRHEATCTSGRLAEELFRKAADRIEALEAALRAILLPARDGVDTLATIQSIAHATLYAASAGQHAAEEIK